MCSVPERHRDGDIQVIDDPIAIAILCSKVFRHVNSSAAKQVKLYVAAVVLPLTAELQRVLAQYPGVVIFDLIAVQARLLRNAEAFAVLYVGEPHFISRRQE